MVNPAAYYDAVLRSLSPARDAFEAADDQFFDVINISLGVVELFSPRGLNAFADYVEAW